MFTDYKHDSPNNNNILLCAGPKERQALKEVLAQHSFNCDDDNFSCALYLHFWKAEDFIGALHRAVQKQAACIEDVNDQLGTEPLRAEDAKISFDRHLSEMCQEDVDKVFRHLRVLFIDRYESHTGVHRLDDVYCESEKKYMYEEIIVPWLNWVRSARQDKSTIEISDKAIN